jgi:hypothetical protein
LQHGADLVRKLAERNFLKIFLRCDQINEGIQEVTEELEDCIKVFHVREPSSIVSLLRVRDVDLTLCDMHSYKPLLTPPRGEFNLRRTGRGIWIYFSQRSTRLMRTMRRCKGLVRLVRRRCLTYLVDRYRLKVLQIKSATL